MFNRQKAVRQRHRGKLLAWGLAVAGSLLLGWWLVGRDGTLAPARPTAAQFANGGLAEEHDARPEVEKSGGSSEGPDRRVALSSEGDRPSLPIRGGGHLTLVSSHGSGTPTEVQWIAENLREDAENLRFITGPVQSGSPLPAGYWHLRSEDRQWSALEPIFELSEGEHLVLWVAPRLLLDVFVVGEEGEPIAGAQVAWVNAVEGQAWLQLADADLIVTTDERGHAQLDLDSPALGQVSALAPGFKPGVQRWFGTSDELLIALRPERAVGRSVLLTDGVTGEPLPGAGVRAWGLEWIGGGEAPGEVMLPASFSEWDSVTLFAEGYLSAHVGVEDIFARGGAVLWPIVRHEVVVFGADGRPSEGVVLWVEAEGDEPFPPPRSPQPLALAEGRFQLQLPMGRRVALTAIGEDGSEARKVVVAGITSNLSHLHLGPRAYLELSFFSSSGEALEARVRVDYSPLETLDLRHSAISGRSVRIINPELVWAVDVEATGVAPLQLRPKAGCDPLTGELALVLRERHAVQVRVIDEEGRGVAGLEVHALPTDHHDAVREHPLLGGGRPTLHPCWSVHLPLGRSSLTDDLGRATVDGLSSGGHIALLRSTRWLPPLSTVQGPGTGNYFVLPSDAEVVLRMRRAELWEVRASDAESGLPVLDPWLTVDGERVVLSSPSGASSWTGWLPTGSRRGRVGAPGYRATEVVLNAERHPGRLLKIVLDPASDLTVRIEGPLPPSFDGKVPYVVFTPLTARGGWTSIASGTLHFDEGGNARMSAPPQAEDSLIRLESISTPDGVYSFEPRAGLLLRPGTPVFRLVAD